MARKKVNFGEGECNGFIVTTGIYLSHGSYAIKSVW